MIINDLAFIEAVMDSTSIIGYINWKYTLVIFLFLSPFALVPIINRSEQPPNWACLVMFILIALAIGRGLLPYSNNIDGINKLLNRVEQDHPEEYGEDKANYVRALYLKCYAENNDSCSTINRFVNGYMIENWEQPIKLKIIKN